MNKPARLVAIGATAILVACSVHLPVTIVLPTCPFNAGDSLTRTHVPATVPAPGESVDVSDAQDHPRSIHISTSDKGVVSIVVRKHGVGKNPELCQLPVTPAPSPSGAVA